MGNLWLFAEEKNVAAQPHPPTNQVQTCIFQIPLGEALKWYMSAKIPEGGGEFHFLAHGLIPPEHVGCPTLSAWSNRLETNRDKYNPDWNEKKGTEKKTTTDSNINQ